MQGILALGIIIGAAVLYFMPTIVATERRHPSTGGVAVLNLLLGWTLLGWVIALAWACAATGKPVKRDMDDEDERACPFCAETIKEAAIVCKHCGRDVPRIAPI